jgi:hypothetical protein
VLAESMWSRGKSDHLTQNFDLFWYKSLHFFASECYRSFIALSRTERLLTVLGSDPIPYIKRDVSTFLLAQPYNAYAVYCHAEASVERRSK